MNNDTATMYKNMLESVDNYKYKIESNDYIWIPKDIPRTFDFYLTRTARVAAIVAAAATVYLAFRP